MWDKVQGTPESFTKKTFREKEKLATRANNLKT